MIERVVRENRVGGILSEHARDLAYEVLIGSGRSTTQA